MKRRIALLAVLALTTIIGAPASSPADVQRTPVTFEVSNPLDPAGGTLTVRGGLFTASEDAGCAKSVMLLVHGLSYGEWAWDFPGHPQSYSVARSLAAAGYPSVAIDLPGYDHSDGGDASGVEYNGYLLTVEGYADMVGQIVTQLHAAPYGFGHVGLMGHSAGTEISELAMGLGLADADAAVFTGYTHFPSQRIVTDFFTGDFVRAARDDYEYFGGTEAGRTEYMYSGSLVDNAIVSADNQRANLTPSGEIYSIGPQPSRYVAPLIKQPFLMVLAEMDLLFPIEFADEEMTLFASAADKDLLTIPGVGHSFMLHTNAATTNAAIVSWLATERTAELPAC